MISEKGNECIEKAITIGFTLTMKIYKLALTTLSICTIHVHQRKAKLYIPVHDQYEIETNKRKGEALRIPCFKILYMKLSNILCLY